VKTGPLIKGLVILFGILPLRAPASPQFFIDQSAFDAAITGASFTTNLSSFPADQVIPSPAAFSGNGLSVEALSTDTAEYELYSFGNELTINPEGFSLVFTNFSSNAVAFGGTFFNLDNGGNLASGNIVLSALFADLSSMTTTNDVTSTSAFFGFVGGTNILSLVVSGEAGLPASGQITLGAPVPEPTTSALLVLSLGALACAAVCRRRR
jgi:hypothetical protein